MRGEEGCGHGCGVDRRSLAGDGESFVEMISRHEAAVGGYLHRRVGRSVAENSWPRCGSPPSGHGRRTTAPMTTRVRGSLAWPQHPAASLAQPASEDLVGDLGDLAPGPTRGRQSMTGLMERPCCVTP